MTKDTKRGKITKQELGRRAIKASLKLSIVYVLYIIAWNYLGSLIESIPGFASTIQSFIVIYAVLIVVGDFTKGTIFHSVFNGARAILVAYYLVFSTGNVVGVTLENVMLTFDISIFVVVAVILSLLGLASAFLEAVHFLNEKAEREANL
jgi:hypothetical protein